MLLAALLWPALLAAEEPSVDEVLDGNADRTPVKTIIPVYPARARRDRLEGEVQVCYHIDRKGRPYRVAVRKSSNRVFEKPAILAVKASSYMPLAKGVRDAGIKACRTFRFTLVPVQDA